MSFGYSIGDGIALVQLAYRVLQGARQACGEHDDLTREVSSLHKVLERLQRELANPESLLNRADDDRRSELDEHGRGCESVLKVMDAIVTKYNKLSEQDGKRTARRLWQKVRFGNGEMRDLAEIRIKLSTYTTAINMSLNLCSLGSQGRVEKELNDVGVRLGGGLEGIRLKVDWIAANMTARSGDGTVWTSYENDDREFWRQLRRELVKEGYRSSVLHKHKGLLKNYVAELGQRGVFDQLSEEEEEDEEDDDEEAESKVDCSLNDHSAQGLLRIDGAESEKTSSEDDDTDSGRRRADTEAESEIEQAGGDVDSGRTIEGSLDSGGNESSIVPTLDPMANISSSPNRGSRLMRNAASALVVLRAKCATVEEILDEDFMPNGHPNCFSNKDQPLLEEETDAQNVHLDPLDPCQVHPNSSDDNSAPSRDPVSASEDKNKDFVWAITNFDVPRTSAIKGTDDLEREWKRRQIAVFHVFKALLETHIIFEDPQRHLWLFPVSKIMTWEALKKSFKRAFPKSQDLGLFVPDGKHELLVGLWERIVTGKKMINASPNTLPEVIKPGTLVMIYVKDPVRPYPLLDEHFDVFSSSSNPSILLWPTLRQSDLNQYLQLVFPESTQPPINTERIQSVLFSGKSRDIPENLVANNVPLYPSNEECACIYRDDRWCSPFARAGGDNHADLYYSRANRKNRARNESGSLHAAQYHSKWAKWSDDVGELESDPENSSRPLPQPAKWNGGHAIPNDLQDSHVNIPHIPLPPSGDRTTSARRRHKDQGGKSKKRTVKP